MLEESHLYPQEPAPADGAYRMAHLFGSRTERVVTVAKGEPLPPAPAGYVWRPVGGGETSPAQNPEDYGDT